MKFKSIIAAAAIALTPVMSSAASVTNLEANLFNVFWDAPAPDTADLGDLNLADGAVGVTNQFSGTFGGGPGTLVFGVYSDPLAGGAQGSVDVNLVIGDVDLGNVSGTFGGAALSFSLEDGDAVASFSTTFASIADIKDFSLTFSGVVPGDLIQVNVAATPVPVPAGILLMGTAIAGFGVMRRRKKRA